MVVLGVDPHKTSHTAAALDAITHYTQETRRVQASLREYRRLLAWGKRFGERQWAMENAHELGKHLAQWLLARGETVVDVPSTTTARVRELSRGGRRKNDALDAAAAASVSAPGGWCGFRPTDARIPSRDRLGQPPTVVSRDRARVRRHYRDELGSTVRGEDTAARSRATAGGCPQGPSPAASGNWPAAGPVEREVMGDGRRTP